MMSEPRLDEALQWIKSRKTPPSAREINNEFGYGSGELSALMRAGRVKDAPIRGGEVTWCVVE